MSGVLLTKAFSLLSYVQCSIENLLRFENLRKERTIGADPRQDNTSLLLAPEKSPAKSYKITIKHQTALSAKDHHSTARKFTQNPQFRKSSVPAGLPVAARGTLQNSSLDAVSAKGAITRTAILPVISRHFQVQFPFHAQQEISYHKPPTLFPLLISLKTQRRYSYPL